MNRTEEKLRRWIYGGPGDADLQDAKDLIECLAKKLYARYEPQAGPNRDFWSRLDAWLENVQAEPDQKTMYRSVPCIFFVGRDEYDALYRVAFNHHIPTWLIDQLNLNISDSNCKTALEQAVERTWFCPISDSMRINGFYHVNQIEGTDYRPDWRSLERFGEVTKIESYLSSERIARLVLLEDFVGTGTQMRKAVSFAASLQGGTLPVLVVPLVICPEGERTASQIESTHPNVRVASVLRLGPNVILGSSNQAGDTPLSRDLREFARRSYTQVSPGWTVGKPYGPFGFGDTGALVVLYSNCPDNTFPFVHHQSGSWMPLFPRSSRL